MQAPLVYIENEKCKVCYACIRICPVKAIELHSNSDIPEINPEKCIGCGDCIDICHPEAIKYYDSKPEVIKMLKSEQKVVALIDPSISAEFEDITDYRKFVTMIMQLGFHQVHEVAFGVDLIAKEYNSLISDFLGKYYILSNCPPIVSIIEKYHPELIENLAPIVNPMIASCKSVRKQYAEPIKTVFIGPCIGAKEEADKHTDDGKVDAVLTFRELRELFLDFDIKESTIEYSDFAEPTGYKGSLFPINTGILQAAGINQDLLSGSVISMQGKEEILSAIHQFETSIDRIHKHFNMFYCEGCMMGPGMKKNGKKYERQATVTNYSNKRLKDFNMARWNNNLKQFQDLNFKTTFVANDKRIADPMEEKVEEVLKIIGKTDSESLGCRACGYDTCRDFAVDVANGITRPDMCIMHSIQSKQDYIKTLKSTNEKLSKAQQILQNSEKKAIVEKQTTQEALETMQTMLQKLPTAVFLVDENLKIISSNESFVTVLGEDAVEISEIIPGLIGADLKTLLPVQFYKLFSYVLNSSEDIIGRDMHLGDKLLILNIFSIKKNKIAGGVIRDMYMPEVRKEEVINRVTEVIEQNLDLVQQIAFLLGEGAANTEKMLNSIIESHQAKPDV